MNPEPTTPDNGDSGTHVPHPLNGAGPRTPHPSSGPVQIDPGSMALQLPIDVRVGPGPDGKPWVLLTFSDQLVTSSVRVPPSAADTLAASISGALSKAATEARRQSSGLVLPS